MTTVRIDFETRSKANLKKVGAWKYSKHPSTEVLCIAWKASNGKRGFWHRAHPAIEIKASPKTELTRLFRLMSRDVRIEAHNVFFERAIWLNVCVPKMEWPKVNDSKWRCSAAKASTCSLPRDLDGAGNALALSKVKDKEGHRIMLKITKPARTSKNFPDRVWYENKEELEKLWSYCRDDVEAEEALSDALPDLSEKEQRVWDMDQRMNLRGIHVDAEGAGIAVELAEKQTDKLNNRLRELTKTIGEGTKRAQIKTWINEQGVTLLDTQADTMDALIADENTPPRVKEVAQIVRYSGKSSVKKYTSMINCADKDGRIRDTMMYHGASTGRWSGKLVQPHNFPRGVFKGEEMEQVWVDIKKADLEYLDVLYGNPMELLSNALRGAICAPPGRVMFVADYAAIEARGVFWLADEQTGLNVFRRKEDIYVDMARKIFGKYVTKEHSYERFVGKQAILGLGFGMGYVKFLIRLRDFNIKFSHRDVLKIVGKDKMTKLGYWIQEYDMQQVRSRIGHPDRETLIELVLMRFIVDAYRKRYKKVVKGWYDLEAAAVNAMLVPGSTHTAMKTSWTYDGCKFLLCKLPSGRYLYYPYPELEPHRGNYKLRYWGVSAKNYQWTKQYTYGGKLAENITQATARDIMADAMLLCDETEIYDVIMSVHDEVACEADEGKGDLSEFMGLVTHQPDWAKGFPVDAEGWTGVRYRKE